MNQQRKTFICADLFCGGGGFTSGLLAAAEALDVDVDLIAVNHWDVAISTHSKNHPRVKHLCETLEGVDPRTVVPGGILDLLLAAPECTHFSNARGGKPMSPQSRASAYHILRWAEALYVKHILVENVREFRDWGPLYAPDHSDEKLRNRPIPEKRGLFYRRFLGDLRAMGYRIETRIVNAAHYGDATTRQRFFLQATRLDQPLTWPTPTHVAPNELEMYEGAKPYRTAREIIDWTLEGTSIYGRKKPLAANTLRRIFAGLQKFSGLPFVLGQQSGATPRSVDDPLPTIASAGAISLVEPAPMTEAEREGCAHGIWPERWEKYWAEKEGEGRAATDKDAELAAMLTPYLVVLRNNQDAKSVDEPLPTITTSPGHFWLCQAELCELPAFLVGAGGPQGCAKPQSVDAPLGTVLTDDHRALCQPFLVAMEHSTEGHARRCQSLDKPLPTITSKGMFAFIEPFFAEYHGGKDGDRRTRSVDTPLPTLDTSNRIALIEAFLVQYNSNGGAHSLDAPVPTLTTKDRFGLVESGLLDKGDRVMRLDIRFRMLKPHELAAAMSFPSNYQFSGSRDEQVKQIGNSVAVRTATALCREILGRAA